MTVFVLLAGAADSVLACSVDHVFVSNENVPNAVRETDPVPNTYVRSYDHDSWSSGGAGRYLAFDGRDHLWVTDNGSRSIYELGENGVCLNSYLTDAIHNMNDIEYSAANDRLYLIVRTGPSGSAEELVEVNPYDGSQIPRIFWGPDFEPNYIGFAPNGDIYITRYSLGADAVRVYDPVTFELKGSIAPPDHGGVFSGIAFVGGDLYLASSEAETWSSWIDEYSLEDGEWQDPVRTDSYGAAGLNWASEYSLWATGHWDGQWAVGEIDIATGDVIRYLDQGGLSCAGNQDIELGCLVPEPAALALLVFTGILASKWRR